MIASSGDPEEVSQTGNIARMEMYEVKTNKNEQTKLFDQAFALDTYSYINLLF